MQSRNKKTENKITKAERHFVQRLMSVAAPSQVNEEISLDNASDILLDTQPRLRNRGRTDCG